MNDSCEKNLKWLLLRVSIPTKQILNKMAEQHGLSMMQLWTLGLLEWEKEIPMNSISSTLGCDASNVTGIVDRLLAMDLIERHECQSDRRIKMIRLTLKGKEIRANVLGDLEKAPVENLDQLTCEEKMTLCILLEKALPHSKKSEN